MMSPDLLRARSDFLTLAQPSTSYCRRLGLDWPEVEAHAGGVFLAPIRPDGAFFDLDPNGVEAAVVEVFAEDAATTIDMVAWLPDSPSQWWTALGAAPALGLAHATNRATYAMGLPLQIYRTPEEWLCETCHGVVMLDMAAGVEWMTTLPLAETIAVRDDAHARQVDKARRRMGLSRHQRLVIPVQDLKEVA